MTKTKLQITIHDCETGEIITKDATTQQIADIENVYETASIKKTELAIKEAQRQEILDRIGLTADELKTILG
jgi:hypothetical protein